MREIALAGYSDIGGRKEDEDSFLYDRSGRGAFWAALADGLGSYGGGKTASQIAVDEFRRLMDGRPFCSARDLRALFDRVNRKILEGQSDDVKMRTTAVFLAVGGSRAVWGHVGDTRLYHYHNGALADYTIDHSVPQLAVAMGEITRDQIPAHPARNKLTRALGAEGVEPVIHGPVRLKKGDHAFLLCSDGFWEYVTEAEMQSDLRASGTPGQWLERMRGRLKERCGAKNDNNTAVTAFARAGGLLL